MNSSPAQTPSGLEDQLRSMILSNVTISNDVSSLNQRSSNIAPRGRGQRRGDNTYSPRRRQNVQHTDPVGTPPSHPRGQPPARGQPHTRGGSVDGPWRSSGPPPTAFPPQSPQQHRQQHHAPQSPLTPRINRGGQRQGPVSPPVAREPAAFGVSQILQRPQSLQNPLHTPGTGFQPPRQNHHPNSNYSNGNNYQAQCQYLDRVATAEIHQVEITTEEKTLKEAFRAKVESLCQSALQEGYSGDMFSIELRCFGSLSSGFATKGSDVDLAIVPYWSPSPNATSGPRLIDRDIPRLLEKKILDSGYGARLLTRTRVPILKVCELPMPELYAALCEERKNWDELSEEEKYPLPATPGMPTNQPSAQDKLADRSSKKQAVHPKNGNKPTDQKPNDENKNPNKASQPSKITHGVGHSSGGKSTTESADGNRNDLHAISQRRFDTPWLREKALGPLDFPKTGVGIQSDINFENPLALHNTTLLRCYCHCDPRIRPMVLFVKAWAKRRKINSSYSGTLSSYGYVLMVLHYLVNVANPPVCPNLQLAWNPTQENADPAKALADTLINGYEVRFWRDEAAIKREALQGKLTSNRQPLGALLRGFFQYYATPGYGVRSFNWMNEVLSLRTQGGIRTKQMKGWTGAKSTLMDGREVRHRYLFAIEDPFEWDHNVARTVTHNGIVAIRDEFRRAWRIISAVGSGMQPEGELFEAVVEMQPIKTPPLTPPPTTVETAESLDANVNVVGEKGGW
ncbi:hypothetical protein BU16DRAFT_523048 [Lophium mytilinum]|uniref:polynucleotide adenylyltransferase n=1 Tax=Lophium mytilinum TaxID=390894 RepID=A0A6A6R9U0_9PEZI|nr:hypothetical protein BU16DRAFT_523048 [Lophium mytilinum]